MNQREPRVGSSRADWPFFGLAASSARETAGRTVNHTDTASKPTEPTMTDAPASALLSFPRVGGHRA